MQLTGSCRRAVVVLLMLACGTALAAPRNPQDIRQRDLKFVPDGQDAPADEPRLRINAGGHTGSVRSLAFASDSSRLYSAGMDKVVQVWNLNVITRDLQTAVLRERTIRWQVARGLRGSIYALALASNRRLLAIGGYGAMGSLGEILLVDPVSGTLTEVLEGGHDTAGHKQTVCSLGFSADGNWLASADTDGQAILWKRGDWKPIALQGPDEKTYGTKAARLIQKQPGLRPIVIVGNSRVILPVYEGQGADGRLRWRLRQFNLADLDDAKTHDTVHHRMVTALAVSPDGSRLASADLRGNLYLWDLKGGGPAERLPTERTTGAVSLCFSPDARTLIAGAWVARAKNHGQLQIWDVQTKTLRRSRALPDLVHACAVSPDGKRVAYSGGMNHEVFVEWLEDVGKPAVLCGKGRRILKVAFAQQKPYRVAFGTEPRPNRRFNDIADLQESFNLERVELEGGDRLQSTKWLDTQWAADHWRQSGEGNWEARRTKPPDDTLQLYRDRKQQGQISLDTRLDEGSPLCYCWIPDRRGKPWAIAVGTAVQNSIYVCRLVEKGPCPILRHFRSHHDNVSSLGVSHDAKYLVSGSADGTVKIWNLAGYDRASALWNRWGADLEIRQDRLIVKTIHEAGRLFHKGVRAGDAISRIRWFADRKGKRRKAESHPGAILESLKNMPWGTQVEFRYSRNGTPQPGFNLLPAWQPLVTLFVAANEEWAFWTPAGYYDASINGYTLFGWQVNRGLHLLPEFYRADQFRKKLERPAVMEKLLSAGSLQEAFRQAGVAPSGRPQQAVRQQIALAPRVEILEPRADAQLRENSTKVKARIKVPAASKLVQARVYANGVVSTRRKLLAEQTLKGEKELIYEWEVPLPADERNLIQVVAGTDTQVTGFRNVLVARTDPPPPAPRKLFILSVGIDDYKDPNVPPLDGSVADARAVMDLVQVRSDGLYTVNVAGLLTNERVTPQNWKASLQAIKNKLANRAKPDDLLILFLAGHGWEDRKTKKYYFIGHEYDLAGLGKVYTGCLSWSDFQILADIPCRKLAVIDTCHSGAIQPPRLRNLKAAVRPLQDDVIFTLTATRGGELAAEDPNSKHGVFTKCLLEALQGKADVSQDGIVTLKEVVDYVQQAVPKTTQRLTGGRRTLTPMAAPDEFLPYITLPLTRVEQGPTKAEKAARSAPGGPGRQP